MIRSEILILLCSTFYTSLFGFKTQYLGKCLTDEGYKSQNICWTKVCVLDSDRLIYAASHDSLAIDPCVDFKTFAMGEFFKHRVLNERYPSIGFLKEITTIHWERLRRVLKDPIYPSEPAIFKVMKSFYKKCTNSSKKFQIKSLKIKNQLFLVRIN